MATILLIAVAGPAAALDKVKYASTHFLSEAVFFITQAEGYFEDEGIEVEEVVWNRDGGTLPAMAQGRLDAGVSTLGPKLFNVTHRGGRIRLVAARTVHSKDHCAYSGFVARSELLDSGRLREPADLRGLRMSVDRTAGYFYFVDRLLQQGGLTDKDLVNNYVPYEMRSDGFEKGLLDVSTATEPWLSRYTRSGAARVWKPMGEVTPGLQATFLVFGRRLLDRERDLGRRFLAAYIRGARAYLEQGKSDRNVAILATRTKLDPVELRAMCWPDWSADGVIDQRMLDDYQTWALGQGLTDARVPIGDVVDTGFLPGSATASGVATSAAHSPQP